MIIKKGDRFKCIQTYKIQQDVLFVEGDHYNSENDGCITDERGDRYCRWSVMDKPETYFVKVETPTKTSRVFESGSKRDSDDNKPLPMELNPYMLLRYGFHMKGAQLHYGDGNWQLGQPDKEVWRSLSRHFTQAMLNHFDPEIGALTDDGSDHLSAMIFGINMLMHNEAKNGVPANKFFKK